MEWHNSTVDSTPATAPAERDKFVQTLQYVCVCVCGGRPTHSIRLRTIRIRITRAQKKYTINMHEWVREMEPEPEPWHDLYRTAERYGVFIGCRSPAHRFRRRRRRCVHIGKPTFKLMNIKWKLTFLEKIGWNEIAFKLDDDETYTELNRLVRAPVDACLCLRETGSWAGHISYGYDHQWSWAYTLGPWTCEQNVLPVLLSGWIRLA